jgi:hypothetical protein
MGGATRDEGRAAAARRARDVPAKGILGGRAGGDPQWFRALATEEGIASLNTHQVRSCPSRSSQAPPPPPEAPCFAACWGECVARSRFRCAGPQWNEDKALWQPALL